MLLTPSPPSPNAPSPPAQPQPPPEATNIPIASPREGWSVTGTAAQIADRLEESFAATGSRGGFMLGHTASPMEDLAGIVELLLPELQRRGRFRTSYATRTLRETLAEG